MTVTLKASDLKALIGMASKDASRTHLNGVRFYNGRMFATDGHALVFVEVPLIGEQLNQYYISSSFVKSLDKNGFIDLDIKNKRASGSYHDYILEVAGSLNIDSFIPKSRAVHDGDLTDEGFVMGFNPELLLRMCKAHPDYKKKKGIKYVFTGKLDPFRVYLDNKLIGVVMPMRV